MPQSSQLELPGSPIEAASWAPAQTVYWNPGPALQAGETINTPVCVVLQYDPDYPNDTKSVGGALLASGSPFLGSGANAGMVGVTFVAAGFAPGYEYRVELSCLSSAGTNPAAFIRVKCKV